MSLVAALRELRLPIPDDRLSAAAVAAAAVLPATLDPPDMARVVRNEMSEWRAQGVPRPQLRAIVEAVLREGAAADGILEPLQGAYLPTHAHLRSQEHATFDQATAILSHAQLIGHLATVGGLSASRIAVVLASLDRAAAVSWQAVRRVLRALEVDRPFTQEQMNAIWADDEAGELVAFADADLASAEALVGDIARGLACPIDIAHELQRMITSPTELHGPHLHMLYYQCAVAEIADHELTVLYEYSPRGRVSTDLWQRKLNLPGGTQNPFLNNAKGVAVLDIGWARARKQGEIASALALVSILEGLDAMGFSARKELARALRRFILRVVRLRSDATSLIALPLSAAGAQRLLDAIASAPTGTFGIAEQRLVDLLALAKHASAAGVVRGIGDPVNASNLSRRKLGDVEVFDAPARRAVAYEAHAGLLTAPYVEGHLLSLSRVVALRRSELLAIAENPGDWTIDIIFVAHGLPDDLPLGTREVHGFPVCVQATTYAELSAECSTPPNAAQVTKHLIEPANQSSVPEAIRTRIAGLLA